MSASAVGLGSKGCTLPMGLRVLPGRVKFAAWCVRITWEARFLKAAPWVRSGTGYGGSEMPEGTADRWPSLPEMYIFMHSEREREREERGDGTALIRIRCQWNAFLRIEFLVVVLLLLLDLFLLHLPLLRGTVASCSFFGPRLRGVRGSCSIRENIWYLGVDFVSFSAIFRWKSFGFCCMFMSACIYSYLFRKFLDFFFQRFGSAMVLTIRVLFALWRTRCWRRKSWVLWSYVFWFHYVFLRFLLFVDRICWNVACFDFPLFSFAVVSVDLMSVFSVDVLSVTG